MPFKAKDEFKAWRNIWQITQPYLLIEVGNVKGSFNE